MYASRAAARRRALAARSFTAPPEGRMGLDAELLDSGCCGLAGSFGFEREHYDISVAIGERRLLPAVRSAAEGTLLIADGFSCKTQIEELAGRRALHTAEVVRMALPGRATAASEAASASG